MNAITDFELRSRPLRGAKGGLPLLVAPAQLGASARQLEEKLNADPSWAKAALLKHGALLFRGFGIDGPKEVERVARAIEPKLANDYLGTSPRDAVTEYVFNASELPDYYPIPQHIEMSFVANPPRTLFFSCLVAPTGPGGETPLVDFRAVSTVSTACSTSGSRWSAAPTQRQCCRSRWSTTKRSRVSTHSAR